MLALNLRYKKIKNLLSNQLFKLAISINPDYFVNLAYRSILKREADQSGAIAYSHTLKKTYDLAGLLTEINESDEQWQRQLIGRSHELINTLFKSTLNREPETEVLNNYATKIIDADALAEIITEISQSEEHWNNLFSAHAPALVSDIFLGLLQREPEPDVLKIYSAKLAETQNLIEILSTICESDALWQKSFNAHSSDLAHILFQGLLGRKIDDEALINYAPKLINANAMTEIIAEIVNSQERWDQSFSNHAPEIVQQVFQGLLHREADAEALDNYSSTLADKLDLTALINEIGISDEHWNKLFSHRSPELVNALFLGLLGREPQPDELKNYSTLLSKADGFITLLDEVSSTDEHKARYFNFTNHATELLDAIYQGLLSRPADESGTKFYEKQIKNPADIINIIATIKDSDEFTSKQASKIIQTAHLNNSGWGQRVNDIDALYRRYNDRPVSSQELANHIAKEEPIGVIHRRLLAGFTPKNSKPRVLIFGAYGNGNLGDVYQALALRDHIKSAWVLEAADIFSCSLLKSSDYPFTEGQKLPSNAILDFDLVNSFDALVIGGGGLLAHPHDPLPDENWVKKINIPIILLGVGASLGLLPQHRALLEQAVHVSARDDVSMNAIRTLRNDVVYAPDPILTALSLDAMVKFDALPLKLVKKIDVLWILKHPSNEHDKKILASILAKIKDDNSKIHTIVAIEPKLDKVLDSYFQDISVIYIDTLSALLNYIKNASVVFSMRYHGAIFSLLMKRPTFGASQSKIKELLSDIGLKNAYIEHSEDISKVLKKGRTAPNVNPITKMQLQFKDALIAFRLPMWSNIDPSHLQDKVSADN